MRSAIALARARLSGGSVTPVSSNDSMRSLRNCASAGVDGATARTRSYSASFWKISTWNDASCRMASSAASRTALSGCTLLRIEIGPSMFSTSCPMRSHSSRTVAGVTSASGSAASASKAARASATICVQAAVNVTASRIGSVIRDKRLSRRTGHRPAQRVLW